MYVKLINGVLTYAPRKVKIGEATVYNPTDEQLASLGYKPLFITDEPQTPDGYHAEPTYTDKENEIEQGWAIVKDEPPRAEIIAPAYDPSALYTREAIVEFEGGLYVLKTERARNIEPTDSTYWLNISLTAFIKDAIKAKENE